MRSIRVTHYVNRLTVVAPYFPWLQGSLPYIKNFLSLVIYHNLCFILCHNDWYMCTYNQLETQDIIKVCILSYFISWIKVTWYKVTCVELQCHGLSMSLTNQLAQIAWDFAHTIQDPIGSSTRYFKCTKWAFSCNYIKTQNWQNVWGLLVIEQNQTIGLFENACPSLGR